MGNNSQSDHFTVLNFNSGVQTDSILNLLYNLILPSCTDAFGSHTLYYTLWALLPPFTDKLIKRPRF